MKRMAAIPVLTLGLVCAAPVGYVLLKQTGATTQSFASVDTSEQQAGRSVLPDPEVDAEKTEAEKAEAEKAEAGKADPDKAGPAAKPPAAKGSGFSITGLLGQAASAFETSDTPAAVAPVARRTHEPRLSIYDTARNCSRDGQDDEMCRAAYRDARRQSERSSDIFEELDACEHRYGDRACYERRLRSDLAFGEVLYMPIMAGFALVTDGRQMVARPIYSCPPQITNGRSCHQTETGMVMRDRDNNRPVSIAEFEQDYTGFILRQTVRETEVRNGRAFVYIRTAAYEEGGQARANANPRQRGAAAAAPRARRKH